MQKRRILIVDNNDELRTILEEVLGKLGHEVVVTGDREQALQREDLEDFDLIISDLTEEAETNGQSHWRTATQAPDSSRLTSRPSRM